MPKLFLKNLLWPPYTLKATVYIHKNQQETTNYNVPNDNSNTALKILQKEFRKLPERNRDDDYKVKDKKDKDVLGIDTLP